MIAGNAGSNPAKGADVSFLELVLSRVGSGLCDELITRSEESYSVCVCVSVCLIVCDLQPSKIRRPRPDLGCSTTGEKINSTLYVSILHHCVRGKCPTCPTLAAVF